MGNRCAIAVRLFSALVVVAWVSQAGGCAAAVATAAPDVAETMIEKGIGLFSIGKVEAYQNVGIDDGIETARTVAKELTLTYVKEEKHPDQLKLIYHDDRKQDITITIVRRSASVTEFHVDVGLFGVEGMGRLVMRRILHHLPGGTTEDKKALEQG